MIPVALSGFLAAHPDVEFIHYNFLDLGGLFQTRCYPKAQCLELAMNDTPGNLGTLCSIGFCNPESLPPTFTSSGWASLRPDWTSLRLIEPHHASVLCNISEEASGHTDVNPEDPYLRCPRSTLKRVVDYAKAQCHVFFLAGFEMEFYLVDADIAETPSKFRQPPYWYINSGCSLRGRYAECAYDCVRQIQEAGIPVNLLHSLKGPQQYQIPIGPLPVLECVDSLVQAMEIIRRVAVKKALRAIFLPKPFPNLESNGLHAHISLNSATASFSGPSYYDGIEESFMAGILDRLPLITAFGMSCQASYKRIKPEVVGKYVAWGTGNRETPLRRVNKNRWELRAIDCLTNPYLTLSLYLASGCLGILSHHELTLKDTREPLDSLGESDLMERGIRTLMPMSFREALDSLQSHKHDEDLQSILGPQILDFYAAVKEGEIGTLAGWSEAEMESMLFESY